MLEAGSGWFQHGKTIGYRDQRVTIGLVRLGGRLTAGIHVRGVRLPVQVHALGADEFIAAHVALSAAQSRLSGRHVRVEQAAG